MEINKEEEVKSNVSIVPYVPTAMAEICEMLVEYITVFQDMTKRLVNASE